MRLPWLLDRIVDELSRRKLIAWVDATCPYCGDKIDVWNHDDWDEGGWKMPCPHCKETVVVSVDTEYSYEVRKDY